MLLTRFSLRDCILASEQQGALWVCLRVCTVGVHSCTSPQTSQGCAVEPALTETDSAAVFSLGVVPASTFSQVQPARLSSPPAPQVLNKCMGRGGDSHWGDIFAFLVPGLCEASGGKIREAWGQHSSSGPQEGCVHHGWGPSLLAAPPSVLR